MSICYNNKKNYGNNEPTERTNKRKPQFENNIPFEWAKEKNCKHPMKKKQQIRSYELCERRDSKNTA